MLRFLLIISLLNGSVINCMENAIKTYNLFWAELTLAFSMRHHPTPSKSLVKEFKQQLQALEVVNDRGKKTILKYMREFDAALILSTDHVETARKNLSEALTDTTHFYDAAFFLTSTKKKRSKQAKYLQVPIPDKSPSTSPTISPNTISDTALQYMPTLFNHKAVH